MQSIGNNFHFNTSFVVSNRFASLNSSSYFFSKKQIYSQMIDLYGWIFWKMKIGWTQLKYLKLIPKTSYSVIIDIVYHFKQENRFILCVEYSFERWCHHSYVTLSLFRNAAKKAGDDAWPYCFSALYIIFVLYIESHSILPNISSFDLNMQIFNLFSIAYCRWPFKILILYHQRKTFGSNL